MRIANLIITPIAAGGAMGALGAWRRRRNEELIRLDRFAYGFCLHSPWLSSASSGVAEAAGRAVSAVPEAIALLARRHCVSTNVCLLV